MKYVALLSGGKDSCYNLVHCAHNGHELVAAASLGPEPGKEELDSYLYQTVGQDAIEFVARALEVPLYRQIIRGDALEQGSEYGGRSANNAGGVAGDETEDLYELLVTVKSHHPDIQGVSVGAILSNYQRVRVEHVCRRLGLTPLCYLWQRDQVELLAEMIEGGMEAILIKAAGIGLTKSHLGKTLAEMQPTLTKLNALYGAHVCGEGGEYESLTLDCPLFKHKIILTETEVVIHSDNDFATVAFLRIKAARLESKSEVAYDLTIPPLLDDRSEILRGAVLESQKTHSTASTSKEDSKFLYPDIPLSKVLRNDGWVAISNVQAQSLNDEMTIEEEVNQCFHVLAARLAEYNLNLSNCAIINICISSMDLFLRVNAAYATFFGISPPARACVGVDLPKGVRVRLECFAFAEQKAGDRQALHVQGLSYWAPANIGPYSQAILAGEHIFVSGQIGLIPSQLTLPSPTSLATEMALSSQHANRVVSALRETSGGWVGHTQLQIYWHTQPSDVAHIRKGYDVGEGYESPILFLTVKELPKNALIENQVLLHTGRYKAVDEDGNESFESCVPSFDQGLGLLGMLSITADRDLEELEDEEGTSLRWEESVVREDGSSCVVVFMRGEFSKQASRFQRMISKHTSTLKTALSARYFFKAGLQDHYYLPDIIFDGALPITPVPCHKISSINPDDWDAAFCFISF